MQVRNQRMLDTLYHTLYADEIKMMEEDAQEEFLYHHGVEGMSWGDRNGPPYPLGGVDKKVARAEYKAKKEKERRLKKLQKAAKKARKIKAKNAKQEAEILKKKQKLVKEGDLDKIRKNANLFTNEELQYVIERDAQKRALGSRDERSADEKFELAMKRMAQIGAIAADAKKVLDAAKTGADILASVKTAKVKDLEMEDKRLSAIKTEWEMRFKGREDTPESRQFINDAVNNQQYKPSKAEKKADKAANKKRIEDLKESKLDKKERELYEKNRAENLRNANKQLNEQIKNRKKSERDEFFGKFKKDKDGSDTKQQPKPQVQQQTQPQPQAKVERLKSQALIADRNKWRSKPVSSVSSASETSSGKSFVSKAFSSDNGSSISSIKLSDLGSSQTYQMGRSAMSSISTNVLPRSAQLSSLTPRTSFSSSMTSISSPLSKSDYATVRNMGASMSSAPSVTRNGMMIGMQNRYGASTGLMDEITSKDERKLKKQNKKRWTFG